MQKSMKNISVATTNDGEIEISQDCGDPNRNDIILITADQVDTLIAWLKDAKEELTKNAK